MVVSLVEVAYGGAMLEGAVQDKNTTGVEGVP